MYVATGTRSTISIRTPRNGRRSTRTRLIQGSAASAASALPEVGPEQRGAVELVHHLLEPGRIGVDGARHLDVVHGEQRGLQDQARADQDCRDDASDDGPAQAAATVAPPDADASGPQPRVDLRAGQVDRAGVERGRLELFEVVVEPDGDDPAAAPAIPTQRRAWPVSPRTRPPTRMWRLATWLAATHRSAAGARRPSPKPNRSFGGGGSPVLAATLHDGNRSSDRARGARRSSPPVGRCRIRYRRPRAERSPPASMNTSSGGTVPAASALARLRPRSFIAGASRSCTPSSRSSKPIWRISLRSAMPAGRQHPGPHLGHERPARRRRCRPRRPG